MNIESVEKLLDETAEARQYQQARTIQHKYPTTDTYPQEIADMLANNLTLDDEEAVQDELLALQQNIVRVIMHNVRQYH